MARPRRGDPDLLPSRAKMLSGETIRVLAKPGARVRDLELDRCSIEHLWIQGQPGVLAEAEALTIRRCKVRALRGVARVVARDVVIGEMKKNPLLVLTNCLFDRVRFEGEFGRWFFAWIEDHLDTKELAHAERFYEGVEWALDLRRARFAELTLRGVPGHLVLRDPATSVLVHRDRLEVDLGWRRLDEWGRPAPGIASELDMFLRRRPALATCVLVAAGLPPDPERLAELERLRAGGWAD